MSKHFEPSWFSKTVSINQVPSINISEIKKDNLSIEPINLHNLRNEMKEDMEKFLSLCGLRPYFESKEYLNYLKNRNHPETVKYNSFWDNLQKMEAEKRKEIEETKASEEPYEEDDDYDDYDDYMDCDPVEEEMYCDDFIENNYSYRYTLNDKEYDEYEHYEDSSSDDEEYIDCNYSDYE